VKGYYLMDSHLNDINFKV